jgi:hypothetical protein
VLDLKVLSTIGLNENGATFQLCDEFFNSGVAQQNLTILPVLETPHLCHFHGKSPVYRYRNSPKCGRARSYNQAGGNPVPEGRPATG